MTVEQIFAPGLLPQVAKPLAVDISTHGSQVVLHYSEPREYAAYTGIEAVIVGARMLARAMEVDPGTAKHVIDLAMALIDGAYDAAGDLKPAGGAVKHELIERHRKTLTRRLEMVMNSRREKKTVSNSVLSKELVEICLKEIFA